MRNKSGRRTYSLPGPDDIVRVELSNGIVVLAHENFTSPSVVVEGLVYGGAIQEPGEKAGLASFTAEVLMYGTRHHTFSELFEEIESNGASLDFSSGGHSLRFGSKSLAEDLPLMLKLAAEVLREPTFPPEYVETVRGQILTGLQVRAHDTQAMASLVFHEMAYPADHPYARSLTGYPETVSAITRDDIINFHSRIGPRGAIVVVVGAVRAEEAIQMVEAVLGDWQNPAQPPIPQAPPAPRLTEKREKFVPIPGKTQSDIVLGYPGPPRRAPDFHAALMANSILGVFGLYGRLGDSIRQQQGLAYYSYSSLGDGLGPGPWRVIAGVAPGEVEQTVEIIRAEIRRLVEEPVAAEELSDNKAFFTGQLVLTLETNEGVAGTIMNMELHDLGMDYLLRYADVINALTVEDVQAAARHYLDPDAFALGVAGPA